MPFYGFWGAILGNIAVNGVPLVLQDAKERKRQRERLFVVLVDDVNQEQRVMRAKAAELSRACLGVARRAKTGGNSDMLGKSFNLMLIFDEGFNVHL